MKLSSGVGLFTKVQGSIVFLALLFSLLFWHPLIFEQKIPWVGDPSRQYYPWFLKLHQSLRSWYLPTWVPEMGAGYPLLAQGEIGAFYPINWLLIFLFSPPTGFKLLFPLHSIIATVGMYLLGRQWRWRRSSALFAGCVFAYSFFFTARSIHVSIAIAASFFCFGVWAIEKSLENNRSVLFLSLVIALQIVGGHPQIAFISICFYTLYFLIRSSFMRYSFRNIYKKWLTFIVAIALGIGLAAIQLLPTWELQQVSARRERDKEFIFSYSLPRSQYLTYFFPYLFGIAPPNSNSGYQQFGGLYWEFALYVGILPLSLAFGGVSRKRPVALVLSMCFLIFAVSALGGYFRPYRVLVNILQLPFRVSARFLLPVTFCVAALAGWGLEEIIRIRKVRQYLFWLYGFLSLFLVGATLYEEMAEIPLIYSAGTFIDTVLTQFIFTEFQPIRLIHFSLRQPHIFLTLLLTVVSCVSLILYVQKKISTQLLCGLVFALFLVDPYLQGFLYQMPVSQSILESPTVFEELREGGRIFTYTEPAAVEVEKMTIQPNLNLIWDISSFNAVTPLPLKLHEELNHLARNNSAFLSQLYVEYVISQSPLSFSQFREIAQTPYSYIYRNSQVLPRAFVATELQITTSKAQTLSIFEQAVSKNKKVAVIETPPIELPLVEKGVRAEVTDIDARPTKVILRADTEQPGLLVLLDSYYPGWQAWVNGQKTPILRTNGFFRGVVVPTGESEIVFQYVPLTLYYGMAISLVVGIYWMYSYTSRRFFEI